MNPYTTRTQARIEPCDLAAATLTGSLLAVTSLAALERQRGCQAGAEMDRLLKKHGVPPTSAASLVTMVRQSIGASLVRVGARLAGTATRGTLPAPAPVSDMLRAAN